MATMESALAQAEKQQKSEIKRLRNAERLNLRKLPPPPPAPIDVRHEQMRTERLLEYNIGDHALAPIIASLLECSPGERLEDVHLREQLPDKPPLCPTLHHAFRLGGRKLPPTWTKVMGAGRNKKVISQLLASESYARWLAAFDRWVQAVVLPDVGEPIYYQRPPTLRVAMPSHAPTIGVHRDADYHGHHAAEINYWVPLTPVSASSTLWLETAPGVGDFGPRPMQIGQCLRFNGSLCRHHTVPNVSGATRVSFDLRCIPLSALAPGENPPTMVGDYRCALMMMHEVGVAGQGHPPNWRPNFGTIEYNLPESTANGGASHCSRQTPDADLACRLFVLNLAWSTTEGELWQHLSSAEGVQLSGACARDAVRSVVILRWANGRSRGIAKVVMRAPTDVVAAIERLNGAELAGRKLTLSHDRL